jgi:sirohydrochlorin ferrochelatase
MAAEDQTPTVLFVAHGSRAEAANEAHVTMAERLQASTGAPVRPAFLELAEPSIPDAIDAVVAEGSQRIVVLPYFLYPGRHMTRDIPGLVTEAETRHPEVTIELLTEFGADGSVLQVLAHQVAGAGLP